jgi:hypothetical protein
MPKHEPGDVRSKGVSQDPAEAYGPPAVEPLANFTDKKDIYRKAYADTDRRVVVTQTQSNQAKAGFGFYGDGYGGDLFAPPIEFAGGFGGLGGNQGLFSPSDPHSNPARYGSFGGFGGHGKEGWTYGRGGSNNIDHQRIAQCILLYKTEGIVQTIVHLLADFSVESIDLVHEDETVHNFYQAWMTKVKLKDRLHRFVVDLLHTGNVFIWTKEAKLKQSEKTAMKRGQASQLIGNELVLQLEDKGGRKLRDKTISVELVGDQFTKFKELSQACRKNATAGQVSEVMLGKAGTRNNPDDSQKDNSNTTVIPWEYTSLNPLQMEPRGSRFANEHYWVMMLSGRDMKPLSRFMSYRYYSDISTTKVNVPEIFKGNLQPARQGSPYAAELKLDPSRLSVIQDITKADYEDWATPQIYPANKEVMFKRLMRQAEISAVETMKHAITLIKLGDVKEGFIPDPEQLERVAAALAGGSQAHHLVWDDLIEGQMLQPNLGNIFDPKKYEQVDKDIYSALGVSETVMNGKGSYANSFMSIKLLLEKLETIRCKLEDWLRVEIKKISDAMKFRRLPSIQWGLMNLRDENAERKLLMDLYDRGILSDESLLERFDADFIVELKRQRFEKGIKEEDNKDIRKDDDKFRSPVMVSQGPFKRGILEPPKPKPAGVAGRPAKTGKPQTKKRNTKPKGMGAIKKFQEYRAFAEDAAKTVSDIATSLAVKAQEIRDSRSLTKAQKQELDQVIIYGLAALDPTIELTEDLVYDLLRGDDSVFATEKCKKIVALYRAEATEANTKEERLDLMCNSFAAINADLLEDSDETS